VKEPKVFISFSQLESEWVKEFADALKVLNIEVYFDIAEVKGDKASRDAVEVGLRKSDAIVTLLPSDPLGAPSLFFELGAALGLQKELIPIVPANVDPESLPLALTARTLVTQQAPRETATQVAKAVRTAVKARTQRDLER